jgi:lipoprotein-releasing system permease protein
LKVPFYIAKRYLFSKKSKNIINIISGISVFGIFISTCAMIIVLSGFNGIEELVEKLYSSFDADIRITRSEGKTFDFHEISKEDILKIEGVDAITEVIEEITMIKHEDRWITATMKGVEDSYLSICHLDSVLTEGEAKLQDDGFNKAIIGIGLQNKVQVTSDPRYHDYLTVYGLLRDEKFSKNNTDAFKPEMISVGGVFAINPEFDNTYFLVPIQFAKNLLEYENDITAYEISVKSEFTNKQVKEEIQKLVGDTFQVKTRYEQNELVFKTNETEKWMVFLILGFILLLSTFNIIASLTMLILDKKKDIETLISMGATRQFILKVFFLEGIFINLLGGIIGISIGLLIAWLQLTFHFVTLDNSVIPYWPVSIHFSDVVMIFGTVVLIGIGSSYIPVSYLIKRHFKKQFN